MENEILKQILNKLETMDNRLINLELGQTELKEDISISNEDILSLKEGQIRIERKISKIERNIDTYVIKDILSLDKRIEALEKRIV